MYKSMNNIVENGQNLTFKNDFRKKGVNGVKKFAPLYFRLNMSKRVQNHEKNQLWQQKRTGKHRGPD